MKTLIDPEMLKIALLELLASHPKRDALLQQIGRQYLDEAGDSNTAYESRKNELNSLARCLEGIPRLR